jgi:hypothetical protein
MLDRLPSLAHLLRVLIEPALHRFKYVLMLLCPQSVPSTKRLIRSLRKSRRNHTARIKWGSAFLHRLGH